MVVSLMPALMRLCWRAHFIPPQLHQTFLPKAGSPALSGASFTGMNSFFTSTTYRGAMGTTNWTANWTNWDPQNASY